MKKPTVPRAGATRVGFLAYRIERWIKPAGEGRAEIHEDKSRYILAPL